MKPITCIKVEVDTTDLDEAIVKAKILNEELEKAKSLAGELAGRNQTAADIKKIAKELNELQIRQLESISIVATPIRPFGTQEIDINSPEKLVPDSLKSI